MLKSKLPLKKEEGRAGEWLAAVRNWSHLSGYSDRRIAGGGAWWEEFDLRIVEYSIKVPLLSGLGGRSLLFFSDLHFDENGIDSSAFYSDIVEKIKPEWIVFGGDLITYACDLQGAFEWLRKVFAEFTDIPKIAVPGNWDRRRKEWFPQRIWEEHYRRCGFHYLLNSSVDFNGIHFYGVDDVRGGDSVLNEDSFKPELFNCIVSHSVEPVADVLTKQKMPGNSLVLCGHSHGGQIRIPLFGALLTSTKYWKLFEYGLYKNKISGTNLLLTSGVGTSRFPFRLFCHPEVVLIKFTN